MKLATTYSFSCEVHLQGCTTGPATAKRVPIIMQRRLLALTKVVMNDSSHMKMSLVKSRHRHEGDPRSRGGCYGKAEEDAMGTSTRILEEPTGVGCGCYSVRSMEWTRPRLHGMVRLASARAVAAAACPPTLPGPGPNLAGPMNNAPNVAVPASANLAERCPFAIHRDRVRLRWHRQAAAVVVRLRARPSVGWSQQAVGRRGVAARLVSASPGGLPHGTSRADGGSVGGRVSSGRRGGGAGISVRTAGSRNRTGEQQP